ncbi:hypothetical protein Tco_0090674 [Tanacetum coccineum]
MQRKQKRDQPELQADKLCPEVESISRDTELQGRREDNRDLQYFVEIRENSYPGTQTANLQNLSDHENNDWRVSVHDRLGNRDVHSRLGQRRSSSESPPSSDSEDSRRKRRRRIREDEDMSLPWRRQKVDAFARRISDFSEDKRRRMPANVKTYDGQDLMSI